MDVQSAPHAGKKRRAEDDLGSEQRLAKRFDLLNLDQIGKLYVPAPQKANQRPPQPHVDNDSMYLDDTKDRVYIHNLDDELSDIEEEKLVFLPDIERKLGTIPQSVLTGEAHPSMGNQLVLYGVPTSLSVPEDQDKVRKAIVESRARAREKQLRDAEQAESIQNITVTEISDGRQSNGHIDTNGVANVEDEGDAMDLG